MNWNHAPPECDEQPSLPKSNAGCSKRAAVKRASKACEYCRARKVRCDVLERDTSCTNCRLDRVPCVVMERKRISGKVLRQHKPEDDPAIKHRNDTNARACAHHDFSYAEARTCGNVNPRDISNLTFHHDPCEPVGCTNEVDRGLGLNILLPYNLCQSRTRRVDTHRRTRVIPPIPSVFEYLRNIASLRGDLPYTPGICIDHDRPITNPSSIEDPQERGINTALSGLPAPLLSGILPSYVEDPPQWMRQDDLEFLRNNDALSIPNSGLINDLLRAYIEFVHPYMPLLDLHEFLGIVDHNNGQNGRVSLLLFQAVLFAGTAFVDMSKLEAVGYATRKAARKAFYRRTRLLYDFDYEMDRLALVQSLLLMTYWFENPDDQKDTWHWMGVAISCAYKMGLHKNPQKTNIDIRKQHLRKRIWWCCFMRDRLVALGMRRPTRIKDEDYDVPMLVLEDFELKALGSDNMTLSEHCIMMGDINMQKNLAMMCIAKAKLCLCIGHVLAVQYSVPVGCRGRTPGKKEINGSGVTLPPNELNKIDELELCDAELTEWIREVDSSYRYVTPTKDEIDRGASPLLVQWALLHMVYYATVSALHRPRLLSSTKTVNLRKCRHSQAVSRKKVEEASKQIAKMSFDLHNFQLERYLPTTGVTVLLLAIMNHLLLLDIKSFSSEESCSGETYEEALKGLCQCIQVLESLRNCYSAADYAMRFLETAICQAHIDGVISSARSQAAASSPSLSYTPSFNDVQIIGNNISFTETDLLRSRTSSIASASTPPSTEASPLNAQIFGTCPFALQSNAYGYGDGSDLAHARNFDGTKYEGHFDVLIDFDNDQCRNVLEEGVHGESGVFPMDTNWLNYSAEQLQWSAG